MLVGAILWLIAAPYVLMFWVLEIGLRFTLRSRIVVEFTEVPGDSDSTDVTFRLRGPCALMLEQRIKRALAPPEIPLRIRRLAGIALPSAAESATEGGRHGG